MPKKITIYLPDSSDAIIEVRRHPTISVSKMMSEMIERYSEICRASQPRFSPAEWQVILEALRNYDGDPKFGKSLVPDTVERHGQHNGLVAKMRELSLAQLFAILDVVERFWASNARGESPALPGGGEAQ